MDNKVYFNLIYLIKDFYNMVINYLILIILIGKYVI